MGLNYLTGTATTSFETAMGFSWQDVIDFTSINIKLVVGSGVGLLSSLVPWIIAIAVIITTISIIFYAFRFFRY